MAIWRRGRADALMRVSDQGSQYTSEQFRQLLGDNGVSCSMSRSGNVWELLLLAEDGTNNYRTRAQAKADVFDYIERFYNPKRRHSTSGYLSTVEFEKKAGLA